jgi:hypothetical protein
VIAARTDVVSSLLRPPELLEAQRRHAAGEPSFQSQLPAAVEGFGRWDLDTFL